MTLYAFIALFLSVLVLLGIHLMNSPRTAVRGNQLGAAAMAAAVVVTLYLSGGLSLPVIWGAMAIGAAIGIYLSMRVKMIQMPQLVALFNGLGGAASALVALLVLAGDDGAGIFSLCTAGLALAVGSLTFSGSLVAAGKLHQVLPQRPLILAGHTLYNGLLIGLMAAALAALSLAGQPITLVAGLIMLVLSLTFGVVFTMRVGGADMPVTISLLNSLSGVAGAIAGMAIADPLLVAVGGIVGASGLLLTQIMCRAMNRRLMDILLGKTSLSGGKARPAFGPASGPEKKTGACAGNNDQAALGKLLQEAKSVLIVPGYGMALSQAQHAVKTLADGLEKNGARVDYAIHPVAGRMPGHMNVLLAEADVAYEHLLEMDEVNPRFKDADLVLVVGANDVINPAANTAEGTPIYGMPVLAVADAPHIIICNFDRKPGYAGVPNPLYERDGVIFLEGDAAASLGRLRQLAAASPAVGPEAASADETLAGLLQAARSVLIVPGYGMALSQAQHAVKTLADGLEKNGARVDYAIHPVAGRMPGHMNVLLAEADVAYEHLLEMDEVNPRFKDADLVLVVGANDVINPAANTAEGTPIYGMPVLAVADAPHIIICNFDRKPGYAGVPNPLYERDGVIFLDGDALESVGKLSRLLAN